MNNGEYNAWLDSLHVNNRVCIRDEVNGTFATKQIVNISPRKLIELRGWKNRFKNGRNKDGFILVPKYKLLEERKQLINEIEACQDRNRRAVLYRKFDNIVDIIDNVTEGSD